VSRLLTLVGAGGVGKTRLAVEAASRLTQRYTDGTWYVDLAPVTDPALVPLVAARASALPDAAGGYSSEGALTRHIGERQLLLVVDNCEHLLDATAALVGAVLSACPNVTVLATSREPLGVSGEQVWRVPSLSLHDDAVELFTERAQRACSGCTLGARDVVVVREICRRLDGMPLAIELAASRVRALSIYEILDGLRDRFHLFSMPEKPTRWERPGRP